MRIGRGRLPRRRDPRRRFRNRLLMGMVGVALLPLVAFAVLAVFELDTVAKSTANATETAILEHQQAIADSALDSRAASLDRTMSAINVDVQEGLTGALVTSLAATQPPAPPRAGPATPPTSYVSLPANVALDAKFAGASLAPQVVQEVTLVLKNNPAINAVWFEDRKTGALRIYSGVSVPGLLTPEALRQNGYVPSQPELRGGVGVLASSEGGLTAASQPNGWVQSGAPGLSAGGPFWTDPYTLIEDGEQGVSAWYQGPSSFLVGVDVSVTKLIQPAVGSASSTVDPLIVSASGMVVYASPQSATDFPGATAGLGFSVKQPRFMSSLRQMELTGAMPQTPLTAILDKVSTDVFTAPVYSGHWIIANPVAVSSLEPNLSALTLGVNDSVHRLFPVTVLPVLILLVGLAFIATTLLSRRMYLPVQALTDHAVLEERTRLAREIHDTLAQQLTGIVLELEAADTLLNRGSERRARSSVEKARELARGALQEARRSVWNLRPAPLSATGLVAAIGHEVEAWEERTGIPARFKARAVPQHSPLSPTAEVALLRIGQEALSNAARHGKPEHVDVELRAHAQELILSITDDGVGFDPSATAPRDDCFGLDGMAERARHAGGTLTVVSAPGHGTTVTTRLPFTEAVAEAVSA
jgi:signal transduction histidine kinase